MTDGFLSRWSMRKQQVRDGKPVLKPQAGSAPDGLPMSPGTTEPAKPDTPVVPPDTAEPAPDLSPAELPTLADARGLTPDSDFKPFMARGVAAEVKNAAMKKLFADPHFNLMDGLDTYIGDYSLPDPIPEAMLRQMVSAKFLNLFGADDQYEIGATSATMPELPRDDLSTAAPPVMAQPPEVPDQRQSVSVTTDPAPAPTARPDQKTSDTEYDHPDLRLQPDHAPAAKAAG